MKKIGIAGICLAITLFTLASCRNASVALPEETRQPDATTPPSPSASPENPGDTGNQDKTISGRITWNDIGLIDAEISITDTTATRIVMSDEAGNFSVSGLKAGTYTLTAEKIGFAFEPLSLTVSSADITGQNLAGTAAPGFAIDPWGYAWDATPRAATNLESAKQICSLLGGRLPTATELYRNCHNNPNDVLAGRTLGGTISPTTESDWLWTSIEYDGSNQNLVRLNDGSIHAAVFAENHVYRCVWPNKDYDSFRGAYIYGPPGDPGFRYNVNGGLFYVDTLNRPPLTYNSAVREAAFYHSFIPPESTYTALIRAGLVNDASNRWNWTSDQQGYNGMQFLVGIVRWTGIDTAFNDEYPLKSDWGYTHNNRFTFRCAGVSASIPPSPKELPSPSSYVDPKSLLKTSNANDGTGSMFTALSACFDNGGHLPTHQELMMLIQAGLPNDSTNQYLWTSEYEDGANVGVIRWRNTDPHFDGYFPTYMAWSAHPLTASTYNYRAVYFPIDEDYGGPPDSACYGGKFAVAKDLGNGKAIRIWTDASNRPAKTLQEAISDCYSAGGQLPSRRDMVELLISGIDNRGDAWVWTSDKGQAAQYEVIKLLENMAGYADQSADTNYSIQVTQSTSNQPTYSYRCVWINEIRIR